MVDEKENVNSLIERIAEKNPDLVEFRLDALSNVEALEAIAKKKTFPAIATDRSSRSNLEPSGTIVKAVKAGFEFADLDISTLKSKDIVRRLKAASNVKVILSFHDFNRTPEPETLHKILMAERELGADICKIVTTATQTRDNLVVLEFLAEKPTETRLVSFAMGQLGTPSRILSPFFGGEFTYAALEDGQSTAPGQLGIDGLRTVWRLIGIS